MLRTGDSPWGVTCFFLTLCGDQNYRSMLPKNLEEHIQKLAYEGAEFETLVNELNRLSPNFPPESVAFVRKKLDDYIVTYQLALEEKNKVLFPLFLGIIIFIFGIAIYLYTQSANTPQNTLLKYAVMLLGAWLTWRSYSKWKLPVSHFMQTSPRTRRKP
jgi:hypothetical protein